MSDQMTDNIYNAIIYTPPMINIPESNRNAIIYTPPMINIPEQPPHLERSSRREDNTLWLAFREFESVLESAWQIDRQPEPKHEPPKIHKMIISTMDDDNECFICMETCQDQDQIKLNCAHTMCTNCITECMKKKDTCPFCREPITDIYTNTDLILPVDDGRRSRSRSPPGSPVWRMNDFDYESLAPSPDNNSIFY